MLTDRPLAHSGASGKTEICSDIQKHTGTLRGIQGHAENTGEYREIQGNTLEYRGIQKYIGEYRIRKNVFISEMVRQ